MKRMILASALTMLAACSILMPGPVQIPTEGALRNQVTRVVERHDEYVTNDPTLDAVAQDAALGESAEALALVQAESVTASELEPALGPVMLRHDNYIRADPDLEILEKDTYLATTSGLRSLIESLMYAPPPAP